MKAIRVHAHGGPDVLRVEDIDIPTPGPGEAVVKIDAAGLNFIDTYYRTGLNAPPSLPFTLGMEAAGRVTAVAPDVTTVSVGDAVGYCMVLGAFAEYARVPAWRLVKLPTGIAAETAAAVMLQGMTAHYLTHDTFPLRAGHTALVHAAAGGAGHLVVQAARLRGATVIATVGSDAKAEIARRAGAQHVVVYTRDDFETEVKRITGGRGVDVVYDSVGASTFEKGLNCLRPRGYMVVFGNSSGPVPPVAPLTLASKGSLFLTRPGLNAYTASQEEIAGRMRDVFGWLSSSRVTLLMNDVRPMTDAARAQEDLEARRTTGKIVLKP